MVGTKLFHPSDIITPSDGNISITKLFVQLFESNVRDVFVFIMCFNRFMIAIINKR